MNRLNRRTFCSLPLLAGLPAWTQTGPPTGDPGAPKPAIEHWKDLRFGMFIHWGPVSLVGTEIGWSRGRGWGSVSFTPVVNTEDADEIRWFEVEKDLPLADPQAQFTGTVLEGLHVAPHRKSVERQSPGAEFLRDQPPSAIALTRRDAGCSVWVGIAWSSRDAA